MKLELRSIVAPGDIKNERLTLRALENLDIGDYIVAQTGYIEDSPTTNFSHSLWFPYKLVNKGDLVVIYTKGGSSKERVLDKGNKAHFFYLGLTEPVWNASRKGALILHAPSWASRPAEELIRK